MARSSDIGAYFDRLTKKGRGGRRLDDADAAPGTSRPSASGPRRTGGGVTDALRDALGKGRAKGTTAAGRVAERITKTAKKTAKKTAEKRTTPKRTAGPDRDRLPAEGVVHVEYSPRRDGDPDPGEVVWAWVPFEEDPSQGKDRPVVIIGRRGDELVGVPLTTKRDEREAQVELGTGGWDPKRRVSYARIWRMLDVDPDRARREGATLDRKRFDVLVAAVDHYYDVAWPSDVRSGDTFDYDY